MLYLTVEKNQSLKKYFIFFYISTCIVYQYKLCQKGKMLKNTKWQRSLYWSSAKEKHKVLIHTESSPLKIKFPHLPGSSYFSISGIDDHG